MAARNAVLSRSGSSDAVSGRRLPNAAPAAAAARTESHALAATTGRSRDEDGATEVRRHQRASHNVRTRAPKTPLPYCAQPQPDSRPCCSASQATWVVPHPPGMRERVPHHVGRRTQGGRERHQQYPAKRRQSSAQGMNGLRRNAPPHRSGRTVNSRPGEKPVPGHEAIPLPSARGLDLRAVARRSPEGDPRGLVVHENGVVAGRGPAGP